MKYIGINYESIVDGKGIRTTIFFSGCTHRCKGCHNKESWDFKAGYDFTEEVLTNIKEQLNQPYMAGITVSGGDLLCNSDEEVEKVLISLRNILRPDQNLWLYTGYEYEEIRKKKYMKYIDVLVDGKFVGDLYDPELNFRGSSNQRIIDVNKTKGKAKPVLLMD